MTAAQYVIRVAGLSKTFDHVRVLNGMAIEVQPSDGVVAITGANAAGKTTLFNILSAIERPDTSPHATVEVLGTDVTKLQPWQVARLGVARLFQDARVFLGLTVLENVQVAGSRHNASSWKQLLRVQRTDQLSHDALEFVGLSDRGKQPASILSLGDRRKLAIACMIRTNAQVLLLDEPVANLDASASAQMTRLILSLQSAGKTVLLIEHNRDIVAAVASVVWTVHQGQCFKV